MTDNQELIKMMEDLGFEYSNIVRPKFVVADTKYNWSELSMQMAEKIFDLVKKREKIARLEERLDWQARLSDYDIRRSVTEQELKNLKEQESK